MAGTCFIKLTPEWSRRPRPRPRRRGFRWRARHPRRHVHDPGAVPSVRVDRLRHPRQAGANFVASIFGNFQQFSS
jgi:hypothetical protein